MCSPKIAFYHFGLLVDRHGLLLNKTFKTSNIKDIKQGVSSYLSEVPVKALIFDRKNFLKWTHLLV